MRAARLIKMVLLLQSRPVMTAAELARELEVSERTVTRDAQALSEAGVPVYADRGRAGGYRLVGGYRTRLTGLARSEAEALFLSGVPGALREMGLEDAASAARLKVSAALLPSLRDAPDNAAQRFHLDAPAWFREPRTPALLPVVAEAVWADRRIRALYRRGETTVERRLDPYGLVLKAGVWYLCARITDAEASPGTASTTGAAAGAGTGAAAGTGIETGTDARTGTGAGPETGARADTGAGSERDTRAGAEADARIGTGAGVGAEAGVYRTYRLDRFGVVEVLAEGFERDSGFDLPGYWAGQAERFARSILRAEVVVRLSPEGVRRLRHAVDPVAAREALGGGGGPDGEGWVTVTLPVESEEVAYAQLTALGAEAEVLAPAPLRERFAADAARLAARYGRGGAG